MLDLAAPRAKNRARQHFTVNYKSQSPNGKKTRSSAKQASGRSSYFLCRALPYRVLNPESRQETSEQTYRPEMIREPLVWAPYSLRTPSYTGFSTKDLPWLVIQ